MKKSFIAIFTAVLVALTLLACTAPTIDSHEATGLKTQFQYGETWSADDGSAGVVTIRYTNGDEFVYPFYECEFDYSAFDQFTPGTYAIGVTVPSENYSFTYNVTVAAPTITKVTATSNKTLFVVGEDFSFEDNLTVNLKYSDGSTREADRGEYEVDYSAFNKDEVGSYDIVVKLTSGEQSSYTVKVIENQIIKIELTSAKTEYVLGEEFDSAISVLATYASGKTQTLEASAYTIDSDNFNPDKRGSYRVYVNLNDSDVYCSYVVTVANNAVVSIDSLVFPEEITVGDTFDQTKIEASVTYKNGETGVLKPEDFSLTGEYDIMTPGEYVVTVQPFDNEISKDLTFKVVPATEKLKVLMIGNSFSDDTSEHVPNVLKSLGFNDIEVGNMFIGGCSLQLHYTNLVNANEAYDFRYNNGSGWNYNVGGKKQSIQYAVAYKDWDFIILQQNSGNSGLPNTYGTLGSLMDAIKPLAKNSEVKFLFNMTWAYQKDYTAAQFGNYGYDQKAMYDAIISTVQSRVVVTKGMTGVIPNGSAIQNARTSFVGDTLTRDGYHLSYDMGRYVAALTLVGKLTGRDLSEVTFAPSSISGPYKKVAIESATNAIKKPFAVTSSKFTELDSITDGLTELKFEDYGWTTTCGFWNSTDKNNFLNRLTLEAHPSDANVKKFVATKRFSKSELPVGSVITVEPGWSYRPDAWTGDSVLTGTRPGNVSVAMVEITNEWWANYKFRAFNVGKGVDLSVNNGHAAAKAAFKIFVPEGAAPEDPFENLTELKTEDYGWTTTCGFWDSANSNHITTPLTMEQYPANALVKKFVATKKFTKTELPVGSVIVIEPGWTYRPDGWTGDSVLTGARPGNVTVSTVTVTEEWWGNFKYRAFNVGKGVDLSVNNGYTAAKAALKIYVPKA